MRAVGTAIGPRTGRRIISAIVALALVAAAFVAVRAWTAATTFSGTAYFTSSVGLYEGDDVMILGVKVGTVTTITPQPDQVRVDFTYDRPVPADVKAVITAPSLVPVRNLTLTPAYDGGDKLADGGTIPISRTVVPVEWDDVKAQLSELAEALGPRGANRDGSLNAALHTAARNLDGNGGSMKATVADMAEAMATLADNDGNLFATVRNLEVFVGALRGADAQVTEFNRRLASVSSTLNRDSGALADAVEGARRALTDLRRFLRKDGDAIAGTLSDSRPALDLLARRRQELANVLHVGPTALSNLYGIYDPVNGSITASPVLDNVSHPGTLLCAILGGLGGTAQDCHDLLTPLAELAALPVPPVPISPIQRNSRTNLADPRTGRRVDPSPSTRMENLFVPGGGE